MVPKGVKLIGYKRIRDDRDFRICCHEAAHAVVALELGLEVAFLNYTPHTQAGDREVLYISEGGSRCREGTTKIAHGLNEFGEALTTALAGTAFTTLCGEAFEDAGDLRWAEALMKRMGLPYTLEAMRPYGKKATELMLIHWRKIFKLGLGLYGKKHLTGDEARAILGMPKSDCD